MTTRIALIGHRFAGGTATGVGQYTAELLTALAARADPSVALVAASTREPAEVSWLPTRYERVVLPGPRKLVTLAWAVAKRPMVDRPLGTPSLVHGLHVWAPLPTRAPLVLTVHDLMPLRHPQWYPRVERWAFERGIAHARDTATRVIVDSATEAANLAQAGIASDRLRVVHLGVGERFRVPPSAEAVADACARHGVQPGTYVLSVGAVSERKNLALVLRALARVTPDALGTPALLVAGPRWSGSDAIGAEVERLQLGARVRFAGYVDADDLPLLLAGARALVHPSRDEGFGLTPLEAMAAGTAALVADAGSLREAVGDAAVVLPLDDVDAWAAAIERVATDDDHRAHLVVKGRAWQSQFTWERTALDTLAVYDEVLT